MEELETIFEDFLVNISCEEVYERDDLYGISHLKDEELVEE